MNAQITQLAKSQALDLLQRVIDRLIFEANEKRDEDQARFDAVEALGALFRSVEALRTNLDVTEVPLKSLAVLADLVGRNYDVVKRGSVPEYFATYFSNLGVDPDEFLLAAGYSLRPSDQLLRTCRHGIDISWDCCLECDCGIEPPPMRWTEGFGGVRS